MMIIRPLISKPRQLMQWDTDGLRDGEKLNLYHPVSGLNDLLGIRNDDYLNAFALLRMIYNDMSWESGRWRRIGFHHP